jgi:phosphatidylglycerol:prolipoprotein diacylglycerol transferase
MINPIAVDLGVVQIHWYAILILSGIIIGTLLAVKRAKFYGITSEQLTDLLILLIPSAIIGARIYYVLFRFDYYASNPGEIIMINNGGLAFYGGLIACVIAIIIYTKRKKIDLINLLDLLAPSCLIGQAIGRWGNFINHEAYGGEVTRKYLEGWHVIPKFVIDNMMIDGSYRFPTFYFESLGCLIAAAVILIFAHRKILGKLGAVGCYLLFYGALRFWIEGQRDDSLYLGPIRISQLVSLSMVVIAVILFIFSKIKRKEKTL